MDPIPQPTYPVCPTCHVPLRPTDYFCYNCGANIHPSPPSTSASTQIVLYLKSALLPPLGIFSGLRYLRQSDSKSHYVGITAILITLASIVLAIVLTAKLFNEINRQVNEQMNAIGSF